MSQKAAPLTEAVAQTLQVTSAALEKAAAAHQFHQTQAAAVLQEIPETVKAAVDNGLIEASEADSLADALRDPVKTIRLLKFAASHNRGQDPQLQGREVDSNGRASQTKAASAKVVAIGGGGFSKQASDDFDRALGLN